MIYGSVCSGIEAATVAWQPLGWKAAFFSEIAKHPRAVLTKHYPHVPLHGDFTTIEEEEYGPIDLLVGGTPCQSFSLSGLRGGLDDDRGNLALEFLRLAQRKRPRWLLWENVPGVLSSYSGTPDDEAVKEWEETSDLACFTQALQELGYGFFGRILDAQYFGIPQRRRRLFIVGYLGDWRPAVAVLLERQSMQGLTPPIREAGSQTIPTLGTSSTFDRGDGSDPLIAHCLDTNAGDYSRAETFNAVPVAFSCKDNLQDIQFDITPTLRAMNSVNANQNAGGQLAVLTCGDRGISVDQAAGNMVVPFNLRARKLTPRECERLQGFPDDYTLIPWKAPRRGDLEEMIPYIMAAGWSREEAEVLALSPDGPRYHEIGNSMAVPVMNWIGKRINFVNHLLAT
ncbi:DNA (cytosine-5-)-methyltransferase [Terasakiella sp. A23]|uniref:DNA cytosine methyltransferase n=1 Tax=Terasakiella sp. FCG-A23 TaxID=3080561 RepID=UPI002955B406|nr:DNA (cytosine-5-)-methyltransferase [Terasakiella sp. A23]MDV7340993.1 DNA (cytosine-5-)-methyltransferase [Terasakiella sp. A23]